MDSEEWDQIERMCRLILAGNTRPNVHFLTFRLIYEKKTGFPDLAQCILDRARGVELMRWNGGKFSNLLHWLSGPSCSKLTTSLVNDSLKFTSSDTQIC